MKIGIIGAGASGSYLAIRLKEKNPSFDVTLIERNDKILKKVLVTGNGRCNYANMGDLTGKYNNELANKLLREFKPQDIVAIFDKYGIHPTYLDELVFPTSLSAQTVVLMLSKKIEELGIKVKLNEIVIDYQKRDNKFYVKTNENEYIFDKLVVSAGGCAYPQLGTDGTLIDILKKKKFTNTLAIRHYRRKINKLLEVNFIDDYDILMEIFEKEDDVIKIMARFDEYDRDKQILIKILLNINKSLKIKDN